MDDTQFIDPVWAEGDTYLQGRAENLQELVDEVLASLETQATALRDWFRLQRRQMQLEAWEKPRSLTGDVSQEEGEKIGYAPINIFVKSQRGSLEIFWQEVHIRSAKSKMRRYVYLPRGKSFRYTDHKLKKSAKPFELELVLETERRAAQLREWWSIWTGIRRDAKSIQKIADASKPVHQPVTSSFDAGIPELVPSEPRS